MVYFCPVHGSLSHSWEGFVLHPFSCQVAQICNILSKFLHLQFAFIKSISLLYKAFIKIFVSVVSTAPNNVVIVFNEPIVLFV